jgi:pyruvate dehydrogenase E1 component alpha subunit
MKRKEGLIVTKQEKKKRAKEFYTIMYRMRRFEEEVFEFYKRGLMPGLAHLYLGEEAVATGVCGALEEKDYIGSTHRGHGHLVGRGADLNRMMAEILGKKTGYSKGKGGSMHIMAMDKGILGANGIVGGEIPIATGSAYASKYKGTDEVTVCFFGDSGSNEGTFHESINMAAAWDLPIVYIVENNLYGISVDIRRVTKEHHIAKRAAGYGIEGITIDGNDVFKVYEEAQKAVDKARNGGGPTIIECMTYRWQGHHVGDPGVYRPEDEVAAWKAKDPIDVLEAASLLTGKEIEEIRQSVEVEIAEACKFAEESPYPDEAEAYTDVFVD